MPIFTIDFPKYGSGMKLFQFGLAKKDLQGWKTIQSASSRED